MYAQYGARKIGKKKTMVLVYPRIPLEKRHEHECVRLCALHPLEQGKRSRLYILVKWSQKEVEASRGGQTLHANLAIGVRERG
jgi:hypothetical protein